MTHALADTDSGLICGFRVTPGRPEVISEPTDDEPAWLHFNLADSRARRWLERRAPVPEAAREALSEPEARPGLRMLLDGFVIVLHDLHHDFGTDPDAFGEVRVCVDARRMITARSHPLRTTDQLRRELLRGAHHPSAMALFTHFIDELADSFARLVGSIADHIDDAEEQVLAGRLQDKGTAIGRERRLMVQLRHVVDRFDAITADLEPVQDRARLLQEAIAGRVGEATNRNPFVLSVVTTVLLPLTLIASMFGMNVALPGADSPHAFWWITGLMIAALGATVALLRMRRMF